MRKLIDGERRTAKLNVVKDLLAASKRPTAEKLAGLKSGPDSNIVQEGGKLSGMNTFLPAVENGSGMEHQRLKLGEGKKKDDDEE